MDFSTITKTSTGNRVESHINQDGITERINHGTVDDKTADKIRNLSDGETLDMGRTQAKGTSDGVTIDGDRLI